MPSRPTPTDIPPTKSLRDAQKDVTRQRLVAAATVVFSRDGYVAGTIEDVAAAAGVSRATFYLHFKDKGEVLSPLLDRLADESMKIYEDLVALGEATPDQLNRWMSDTVRYWERNLREVDVVQQALATDPSSTESYLLALEKSVRIMSEHLVERRGIDQAEARLTGRLLILQLDRLCFFWIVRGMPVDMDRDSIIELMTSIWWKALYAEDVGTRKRES